MKRGLYILMLGLFPLLNFAQVERAPEAASGRSLPPAKVAYDFTADSLIFDSLQAAFGHNKILPAGYELPALRALSHYPELRDVPVAFVYRKNPVAHTSRPRNCSLFRGKRHRKYLVIISTQLKPELEPGMLRHLSYNAQIGVLGHELAHTVDYLDRGFFNLIGLGIQYGTSKKVVQRWENFTDSTAIRHHLGYQLLAWSREVHALLEAAGRGQNYLTPEQIQAVMRLEEED